MPRLVPVAKNYPRPLCRNPLIATGFSVTYTVTDHNPANLRMQPSAPWRSSAPRLMRHVGPTEHRARIDEKTYGALYGPAGKGLHVYVCLAPAVVSSLAAVANQNSQMAQDEAALEKIHHDLAKAWISGDRTTIERIIAPEWRSTGPDGRSSDRGSVLAEVFETRVHKIRRVDNDDVQVRVFGDSNHQRKSRDAP